MSEDINCILNNVFNPKFLAEKGGNKYRIDEPQNASGDKSKGNYVELRNIGQARCLKFDKPGLPDPFPYFNDYERLKEKCDNIIFQYNPITNTLNVLIAELKSKRNLNKGISQIIHGKFLVDFIEQILKKEIHNFNCKLNIKGVLFCTDRKGTEKLPTKRITYKTSTKYNIQLAKESANQEFGLSLFFS